MTEDDERDVDATKDSTIHGSLIEQLYQSIHKSSPMVLEHLFLCSLQGEHVLIITIIMYVRR
jgi:hypothetical protein